MEKFRDMFELIRLGSDEEIVSKIISDLKILKELGENFALTEACIYYGEELKSKNKYSAIDLLLSTLDDSILCFRVITSFINCFYSARVKLPSYDNFWKKSLQIFPDKIGILQRYEWLMLNKEETELLKIKFRDSTTFICAMKVMRASKYEITARDILDAYYQGRFVLVNERDLEKFL